MMAKFNKVQGKVFFKIEFVLRAIGNKNILNPALRYLYVDDENIVCTDSTRLHYSKNEYCGEKILEPGFYKIIKNSGGEIILEKESEEYEPQFPPYKQIIPDTKNKFNMFISWHFKHEESRAVAELHRDILKQNFFRISFIRDIIKPYSKKDETNRFNVFVPESELSPVLFSEEVGENENPCIALVMPITN